MIQTTPAPDALMEHYYELALTQSIPDIRAYAEAWLYLAECFAAEDRPHMAAACQKRGELYAQEAGGEYIRLIEGSLSELIQVAYGEALSAA